MKSFAFSVLLTTLLLVTKGLAFTVPQTQAKQSSTTSLAMSATASSTLETTDKGLLKRDRYMATNRFAVRRDKQAKFEQRWANRKSRLASLDGFRYFHLMRRVTRDGGAYDVGETDEAAQENYVSITVWDKKSHFSAWRKGDAFKEAHGGKSIGAFVSTMVNSALVLRGPPRPAFYDGLFVTSSAPENLPETVDGWRTVEADGVETLPAECYVCLEKYFTPQSPDFEQMDVWKNKVETLKEAEGLVTFSLMRRDGAAKGHGAVEMDASEPTYVATYVFQDRASFDAWAETVKEDVEDARMEKVYYEGTLVISKADGA